MLKSLKTSFLLTLGLLFVLAFPSATWAHSKLETSSPAADAKLTESVKEFSLTFNENIDENLSTLKVKNDQGEEVKLSGTQVNGNTLSGTVDEPLPSGSYTVEWKIVGGDGHPVDGTYSFQVDAPEKEPALEEEPAPDAAAGTDNASADDGTASNGEAAAGQTDSAADTNQQANADQQADNGADNEKQAANGEPKQSEGGNSTVWIVVVVIVVFIAAYFAIRASRKRK